MTSPTVGVAPLAAGFRDGSDDPVTALTRVLAAADRGKDDKAILWRVPTAAAEARAARDRFQRGQPLSSFDGVPVAVKDCMDVAGLPSTNGTRFLTEPMPTDAPLVQRLRAAGAVIFGRHGDEARVLAAARKIERAFGPRRPPRWHG
jgi:amidase